MKTKLNYSKYTLYMKKMKVGNQLGRKRLKKVKKPLTLSIDQELLQALETDGVNKSRLFSLIAKKYLRKKGKK